LPLTQRLIDGLRAADGVTAYGGLDVERQTATVLFSVAGMAPSEAGLRLNEEYDVN
jgi:selenocysteine lyase/cysteine desulfurase